VITVNGRQRRVEPASTVTTLLEELGFAGRYALVELNGEAIDRDRFGESRLEDGDVVVVARPVAGG
jgi:sulfur carrier protein